MDEVTTSGPTKEEIAKAVMRIAKLGYTALLESAPESMGKFREGLAALSPHNDLSGTDRLRRMRTLQIFSKNPKQMAALIIEGLRLEDLDEILDYMPDVISHIPTDEEIGAYVAAHGVELNNTDDVVCLRLYLGGLALAARFREREDRMKHIETWNEKIVPYLFLGRADQDDFKLSAPKVMAFRMTQPPDAPLLET